MKPFAVSDLIKILSKFDQNESADFVFCGTHCEKMELDMKKAPTVTLVLNNLKKD